jgi:ADP-dependent NAD(P)H-hydrate dehydratase / NAD(P)H-hydrate epimerase
LPQLPLEAVKMLLPDSIEPWQNALKNPGSIFIGPGVGRELSVQKRLECLWPHCTVPTVVDADGLYYLSKRPINSWHVENKILTPHKKEASNLFQKPIDRIDDTVLNLLRTSALTTQSIIILKGAPTYITCPQHPILIMPFGNPGMATAGCGDVLTGMLAGLLAKNLPPISAAMLATSLHGIAGEAAATRQTSYSVTASSIISSIPEAIYKIMSLTPSGKGRSYVAYGRSG